MALNKLKKWVGTQLWSTFMTEYNDNVDATNAAIDLVESHLADYASLIAGGTPIKLTLQNGWTGSLYVKKSRWGHVTIYGAITPGTTTAATVIAVMPNGYRGVQITSVPAYVASAGLRNSLGLIITLNGDLSIYEPLSNVLGTARVEINYVYQAE